MTDTNTDQPAAQPATPPPTMPFWRSPIIVGILTAVVTQIAARIKAKYHIDISVLGISVDDVVELVLDGISGAAAAWALHARATQKHAPQITLTKAPAPPATGASDVSTH